MNRIAPAREENPRSYRFARACGRRWRDAKAATTVGASKLCRKVPGPNFTVSSAMDTIKKGKALHVKSAPQRTIETFGYGRVFTKAIIGQHTRYTARGGGAKNGNKK